MAIMPLWLEKRWVRIELFRRIERSYLQVITGVLQCS